MLQEARDLQNNAVSSLVNIVLKENKSEFTFKAPTGSGKTYMMADFMNRILSLSTQENIVFIVSALSKSNLAEQNFQSFKLYAESGIFPNLNPFLIQSTSSGEGSLFIPTEHNVYVLPRDLYKDTAKLKKEGTFLNFLHFVTGTVFEQEQSKGKLIYLIRDECHVETKNLNMLSDYFYKVINFSATPDNKKKKQHPDVEISNEEAEAVKLIKRVEEGSLEDSLETALDKFEKISVSYRNEIGVNPCMIIQISNKNKAEEELKNTIYPALAKYQDLKWVYISCKTEDNPEIDQNSDTNDSGLKKLPISRWKDYMKEKSSSISVIIFKMVIAEGWDIPRACMLYQIRDSQSNQLDEQVMGRVRRNPRLLDFEKLPEKTQELALTAWIWGIMPKSKHPAKSVYLLKNYNIERSIRVKPTKLQNISNEKSFDLASYVKTLKDKNLVHPSIFEMYQNLTRQDNEIQEMCYEYADSFDKWRVFAENLSSIKSTYQKYICDYEKSMVVCEDVSFPYSSSFNENDKSLILEDWVWCRKDNINVFSFDSYAEQKWADELKDIRTTFIGETESLAENKFLWGKNFPMNSEIKFEYYLNGIHSSYPDFVMKDKKGRIHIFEVKSVNKSSDIKIDENEYIEKCKELKKCYKECSKKTNHIFYLPVLSGSEWTISRFENGEETTINKQQFKDSLK